MIQKLRNHRYQIVKNYELMENFDDKGGFQIRPSTTAQKQSQVEICYDLKEEF